ncbi:hypothetical protein LAC81_30150 [Ensifer adhaerens]|nr:hypothetical protein [Ensifer adhaerens]UAX97777.1 hypothetical protein LAC78_33680 [Ensifer adhaerens]UAY05066.1 hypothetical protein LAC80_26630 [Ensifer adhaerens]UAY12486.1 hypothetical protein LAC81_30150 [Ensifer adhaerens]
MAPRFDSLNKLFESVRESNHDFRVTTDPFPPLDVDKLERTLELEEKGTRNGKANTPKEDSRDQDEVERGIAERIESLRDDAYQVLEGHLSTYGTRLRNLDFDGHFNRIQVVNNASVDDFRADVATGRDELHGLRKDLRESDVELANFRKLNGLELRVARTKGRMATILKWCVILALLIVETMVNGIYLAKGNDQGLVGGIGYAFSFAFANVVSTVVLGLFVVPRVVHRSFWWKLVGLLGIAAWLTVALGLNLVMAHYREVSATAFDNVGRIVMERLTNAPLVMNDIDSWVLFASGVLFSTIALIDSLLMKDPYPGYADTYTRYVDARDDYIDRKADLIDQLKGIRDDHNQKVDGIILALSQRRKECAAIIDSRTRMIKQFSEHQNHLEVSGRRLFATYREANRATRTEPQPKRFSTQYSLDRRKPAIDKSDDWSDKELGERIKAAQAEMADQMKRISAEFEAAVTAYHQLDNLFPETINGPAQA